MAALVSEHGHVYAVEELPNAIRELCTTSWRLPSSSDPTVARLIAKHGYLDLAKVSYFLLSGLESEYNLLRASKIEQQE